MQKIHGKWKCHQITFLLNVLSQLLSNIQNTLDKTTSAVGEFPCHVLGPVAAESRLGRGCIGQTMATDVTAATAVAQGLHSQPCSSGPCHPQLPQGGDLAQARALALRWPGWGACSSRAPQFLTSASLGLRSEDVPCWGFLRLCFINPLVYRVISRIPKSLSYLEVRSCLLPFKKNCISFRNPT